MKMKYSEFSPVVLPESLYYAFLCIIKQLLFAHEDTHSSKMTAFFFLAPTFMLKLIFCVCIYINHIPISLSIVHTYHFLNQLI